MKPETKGEQQPVIAVTWHWDGKSTPAWRRLADRLLRRRKAAGTEATGDGGKKKDS